jgi:hypothetical protein
MVGRRSGRAIEVAVDGCWAAATLERSLGDFAWQGWTFNWDAMPGDHVLACRAIDAAGNVQPLEAPWNYQGMGNNVVQRVSVTVRSAGGLAHKSDSMADRSRKACNWGSRIEMRSPRFARLVMNYKRTRPSTTTSSSRWARFSDEHFVPAITRARDEGKKHETIRDTIRRG